MTEDIAARLKRARKAAGFRTATEASASLGVPYPTYVAHENGSRDLQVDPAVLYARRFKVSLDWLLTGSGKGPGQGEAPITGAAAIRATLERIEGLTQKDVDVAYGVIANAIVVNRVGSEPSAPDDRRPPAIPRHGAAPSR